MAGPMMSGCPILSRGLVWRACGHRGADVRPDFKASKRDGASLMLGRSQPAMGDPPTQRAADRSAALRCRSLRISSLQVGNCREVGRELGHAHRAAPVGAEAAGVDRRDVGWAEAGGAVVAGEGVAIALRQIRVVVTQIQREDLVGEADADVPGVIAWLGDTVREWSTEDGTSGRSIECIRGAKPLPAELAGNVHANAAAAEDGARGRPLGGHRRVVAPSAEVQEVRRVVFVEADRPLVVDGDVDLGVAFIKAGISLAEVAVDRQAVAETEIKALIEERTAIGDRKSGV